jgi:SAM-dependent methyltransferase
MRSNVRAFVEIAAEAFALDGPVYEFGSYLVENQHGRGDLRKVFRGRKFIGCDMREGPGVDRVCDLADLDLPDECAQTILCLDTLEHVFEARRAVEEMIRVLAPGGMLLVSVPMDFRIHDYPSDYWRITPSCLARLLAPLDATMIGSQGVENYPHTVLGVGCKTPVSGRFARGANRFLEGYQAWLDDQVGHLPLRKRLKQWTIGRLRSKGERRRLAAWHQCRFALHMPARSWLAARGSDSQTLPAMTGSRFDLIGE